MDKPTAPKAGAMLHLRGNTLSEGDPVALPLTQSSMYHLPGDWSGGPSYGRADNATWEHLEHVLGYLEDAPVLAYPPAWRRSRRRCLPRSRQAPAS